VSELKDCPFCGNEGETEAIVGGQCWGVGCTNCDYQLMSGPVGIGWFRTEAEAIAAWNTRALTRSVVPAGWQPIETAPKDRTHTLAWFPSCECSFTVVWMEDAWSFAGAGLVPYGKPTHWQPCPAPPTDSRGAE
jgi:hypothetical protein